MKRIIVFFMFLAAIPQNIFADCIACTTSHGIKITLGDGSNEQGYIAWSAYKYWELMGLYTHKIHAPVQDMVMRKGWTEYGTVNSIEEEETFNRWAQLVSYVLANKADFPETMSKELKIYLEIESTKYPIERYVGVSDKVRIVPWTKIQKVEDEKTLTLRVDTTGMDILASTSVARLQLPPKYSATAEMNAGSEIFAVYGDSLPLASLLDHVANRVDRDGLRILVNNVDISTHCPDSLPSNDLQGCEYFREKWGKYHIMEQKVRDCSNKAAGLSFQKSLLTNEKAKQDLDAKIALQHKICGIEQKKLDKETFKDLGSKEDLSNLGAINFHYSWD